MATSTDRNPKHNECDWRCSGCFKLLGRRLNGHVHVHFARGHQYQMSLPVSALCRSCGTLNAIKS